MNLNSSPKKFFWFLKCSPQFLNIFEKFSKILEISFPFIVIE